jgi:hypothetical protein
VGGVNRPFASPGPTCDPAYSHASGGGGGGAYKSKFFKQTVNEYTITMDIKIAEEPPREGLALYQTDLVHCEVWMTNIPIYIGI